MAGELAIPRQEAASTKIEPKTTGLAATLKREFRRVMERLTRPAGPRPRTRRRRTEETRGGFKLAAIKLMRRVVRAAHIPHPIWDALTWLRQWEFDDPIPAEEIFQSPDPPECIQEYVDLSPRP